MTDCHLIEELGQSNKLGAGMVWGQAPRNFCGFNPRDVYVKPWTSGEALVVESGTARADTNADAAYEMRLRSGAATAATFARMTLYLLTGTGAGQSNYILGASSAGTSYLSLSKPWTTNTDATTTYKIVTDDLIRHNAGYEYLCTGTPNAMASTCANAPTHTTIYNGSNAGSSDVTGADGYTWRCLRAAQSDWSLMATWASVSGQAKTYADVGTLFYTSAFNVYMIVGFTSGSGGTFGTTQPSSTSTTVIQTSGGVRYRFMGTFVANNFASGNAAVYRNNPVYSANWVRVWHPTYSDFVRLNHNDDAYGFAAHIYTAAAIVDKYLTDTTLTSQGVTPDQIFIVQSSVGGTTLGRITGLNNWSVEEWDANTAFSLLKTSCTNTINARNKLVASPYSFTNVKFDFQVNCQGETDALRGDFAYKFGTNLLSKWARKNDRYNFTDGAGTLLIEVMPNIPYNTANPQLVCSHSATTKQIHGEISRAVAIYQGFHANNVNRAVAIDTSGVDKYHEQGSVANDGIHWVDRPLSLMAQDIAAAFVAKVAAVSAAYTPPNLGAGNTSLGSLPAVSITLTSPPSNNEYSAGSAVSATAADSTSQVSGSGFTWVCDEDSSMNDTGASYSKTPTKYNGLCLRLLGQNAKHYFSQDYKWLHVAAPRDFSALGTAKHWLRGHMNYTYDSSTHLITASSTVNRSAGSLAENPTFAGTGNPKASHRGLVLQINENIRPSNEIDDTNNWVRLMRVRFTSIPNITAPCHLYGATAVSSMTGGYIGMAQDVTSYMGGGSRTSIRPGAYYYNLAIILAAGAGGLAGSSYVAQDIADAEQDVVIGARKYGNKWRFFHVSGASVVQSDEATVAAITNNVTTESIGASAAVANSGAEAIYEEVIGFGSTGLPGTATALDSAISAFMLQMAANDVPSAGIAASVSSAATASAALTTSVRLASSVTAASTATGAITTAIQVAASVASVATPTAALTAAIRLAASVSATATAAATLNTGNSLVSTVSVAPSATAALTTAVRLAGALTEVPTAMAALSTGIALAAARSSIATASADLSVGSGDTPEFAYFRTNDAGGGNYYFRTNEFDSSFGANLTSTATATAALTTGIRLAAAASVSPSRIAALTTAVRLAANISVVPTMTGYMPDTNGLMSAVGGIVNASANLTTGIRMAAAAAARSVATGTLFAPPQSTIAGYFRTNDAGGGNRYFRTNSYNAPLQASVSCVATATATLNVSYIAAAVASNARVVDAQLSTQVKLAAAASSVATAVADLIVFKTQTFFLDSDDAGPGIFYLSSGDAGGSMGAPISCQNTASASLTTSVKLAASVSAQPTVNAALNNQIRLAASAASVATAQAAPTTGILLRVNLASAADSAAAINTGIALAASAAAQSSMSATIGSGITFFGVASVTPTISAALNTAIRLQASAQGVATATADLSTLPTQLDGPIQCAITAQADLTTGVRIAAAVSANSSVAPAALDTSIALAASIAIAPTVAADLRSGTSLAASIAMIATSGAHLSTGIQLAATPQSSAQWSIPADQPSTAIPLFANALAAQATAVADLSATISLEGRIASTVSINGHIDTNLLLGVALASANTVSALLYHWRYIGTASGAAESTATATLGELHLPPWASVSDGRWKTRTVIAPRRRLEVS